MENMENTGTKDVGTASEQRTVHIDPKLKIKPEGFEGALSDFGPVIYDGGCGEVIGWGFKIIDRMPEDVFRMLGRFGSLECCYPNWYLVTKELTFQEAEGLYGKLNHVERGPRGGYKWSQFGNKKFLKKFERI